MIMGKLGKLMKLNAGLSIFYESSSNGKSKNTSLKVKTCVKLSPESIKLLKDLDIPKCGPGSKNLL
jgi:hypothetical protein